MACREALSTLTPPHLVSGAVDRTPFELIELVNKIKKICSIKKFDIREAEVKQKYVITPTRDVLVGIDQHGRKIIFIKYRLGEKFTAKTEQIAFMISNRLNLNVVPPTMAIEGHQDLIDQITSHDQSKYLLSHAGVNCEGVTVQETVSLNPYQIHLEAHIGENDANALSQHLSFLDTDQLCNAIFFNIITGRVDSDRVNSVIDKFNQIIELDVESIGGEKTESWMLRFFSDFVLPKKPIENLLAKDVSIIDGVFNDVSHLPATKFWNNDTQKRDIEDNSQNNITANFVRLKKYLAENKDKVIKVCDLNQMLYPFSKISVKFDTHFGQSLVICGTGANALDWDPKKALPMKSHPGNIWTIDIETGNPISFKVLLKESNGELKWMQGSNINIQSGQQVNIPSDKLVFS